MALGCWRAVDRSVRVARGDVGAARAHADVGGFRRRGSNGAALLPDALSEGLAALTVDDLLAESLALAEHRPSETALTHARDAGGAMRLLVVCLLRSGTLERAMALVARALLGGAVAVQFVVHWPLSWRVRMEDLASNPAAAHRDEPSQVLLRAEEPALLIDTLENRTLAPARAAVPSYGLAPSRRCTRTAMPFLGAWAPMR